MKQTKKPLKQMNNTEAITAMMTFSEYGTLVQAFIIEAISQYADEVSEIDPKEFPNHGLISGEAWVGVAKEVKQKLKEHLGR